MVNQQGRGQSDVSFISNICVDKMWNPSLAAHVSNSYLVVFYKCTMLRVKGSDSLLSIINIVCLYTPSFMTEFLTEIQEKTAHSHVVY